MAGKTSQPEVIPLHPSIPAALETYPGLYPRNLVAFAAMVAAARTSLRGARSLVFPPPSGKLVKAELNARSMPSTLRLTMDGAEIGAAYPNKWHREWFLRISIDGSTVRTHPEDDLRWGALSLNHSHKGAFRSELRSVLDEGILLSADSDTAGILRCLTLDAQQAPLTTNGEEDGYVPVPPWFADGAALELDPGTGTAIRTSSALTRHVHHFTPESLHVDLCGGRSDAPTTLALGPDRITFHAPNWPTRAEDARQRALRAVLGTLEGLLAGIDRPPPRLREQMGVWRSAVLAVYNQRQGRPWVPALAPNTYGPRLPAEPGHRIPVGLIIDRGAEPLDEVHLAQLADMATQWATLRSKHFRWRLSTRKPYTDIDYYKGPSREIRDGHRYAVVAYTDMVSGSLVGARDLEPDDCEPSWRVVWDGGPDRWLLTVRAMAKRGTSFLYGAEYVSYLVALSWLVSNTMPDTRQQVLWLTP